MKSVSKLQEVVCHNRNLVCYTLACSYALICAQHAYASEFLSEEGPTPELDEVIPGEYYVCTMNVDPKTRGKIVLNTDNKLMLYPSEFG